MIKKLINNIKNFKKTKTPLNPSKFGDPIAEQTKWGPAKAGGSNSCTHKLIQTNPYTFEFKASLKAKLAYTLFIFLGLIISSYSLFAISKNGLTAEYIIYVLISLTFPIIGCRMLYFGTRPIVFDKISDNFWKGNQNPKQIINKTSIEQYCKISDIHSLQIISEFISGKHTAFYSYELNLVLNDAKRINIIDHGNLKKIRQDAETLSEFLGKPVWDGA